MEFKGKDEDIRGKRWNFENKSNLISLFEIKKGFVRGGQYHTNEVLHILVSGKVEYRKENIFTHNEEIQFLDSPSLTCLHPQTSDLITALEDSIMIGVYKKEITKTFYEKHSQIVKKSMNFNNKSKNHDN
jgi:hypothetical protein